MSKYSDNSSEQSSPAGNLPAGRLATAGEGKGRPIFAQLVSLLVGIIGITIYIELRREDRARPHAGLAVAEKKPAAAVAVPPAPAPAPVKPPPPAAPPAPVLDRAAVAAAEATLDAASRDRARADHRVALLSRQLAAAASQAALDASRGRKLAYVIRDPSTRITQASTRGGFVRGERDKLAKELSTLKSLPRPKLVSILSKSPVAKPAFSDEFHFELRRNRVSFINLNRLLELTKADAQVRIRMADRTGMIQSKVGPVGGFSLEYELGRSVPGSMEELIERKSIRFDLRSWEIVPESENRGEAYDLLKNPASDFTRAINKMNPARSTVTLWVYPDSFDLYRRLRDDLTENGFSVAARPLPEGMSIRGSPMGTQSAAQ